MRPIFCGWLWGLSLAALFAADSPMATGPLFKTAVGDVEIFPAENPWNQQVATLRVHARSAEYLKSVGLDKPLHPDFGVMWQGAPNGMPFAVVNADQAACRVAFEYPEESDAGPYPIPKDVPIEGGPRGTGDRHVLLIDPSQKKLFELYRAFPQADGSWKAGSGAIFDLTSNALRPAGWTSADAAGLPIFPGLVRYDEACESGEIRHALRVTIRRTQRGYVSPARHFASKLPDPALMPMGLRVRLRQDFDERPFAKPARVILRCLKTYGMLVADNGGDFYLSGAPDARWDEEALATLKRVKVRDFECLETGPIVTR